MKFPNTSPLPGESQAAGVNHLQLHGIYIRLCTRRQRQEVWVVDGSKVRRDLFDEFLEGGNDQRYRFVPKGEIWIDGATSVEEYIYALDHELFERELMLTRQMTYDNAHKAALLHERALRLENKIVTDAHELKLPPMPPLDSEGNQEIEEIGTKVVLRDVYRARLPMQSGLHIWVVDGSIVRRDIFPDFGFSGNDLYYQFIPKREIWIDQQVNCAEMEYQIIHQLHERAALARGADAGSAYVRGSNAQTKARRRDAQIGARKEAQMEPVELGTRDRGVKAAQMARQSPRANRKR